MLFMFIVLFGTWEDKTMPELLDGKSIIIAAHGNSLRALSKYIGNETMDLEMAAGEQSIYDFDEN